MDTGFQLRDFLPYRLSSLAERVSQSLAAVYAEEFDVSIAQWRVLAILSDAPGLTAKAVGAAANLDKVRVSRAVTGLEARGLLDRRRNAADGRTSEMHLTAEGMALFEQIAPHALAWESQFMARLSVDDRSALLSALATLEDDVPGCATPSRSRPAPVPNQAAQPLELRS